LRSLYPRVVDRGLVVKRQRWVNLQNVVRFSLMFGVPCAGQRDFLGQSGHDLIRDLLGHNLGIVESPEIAESEQGVCRIIRFMLSLIDVVDVEVRGKVSRAAVRARIEGAT
jgi:hypothetical protein